MLPGIDPQKLATVQKVSQNIRANIVINYKKNEATLGLTSADPEAAAMIPNLLDQFAGGLATQLKTFFQINGEIKEIGKK